MKLSTLLFLIVNTAIGQVASLAHSVGFLLTPQGNGKLTPLEQTLRSFGISPSQIATARAHIVSSIEGLAGSAVPLLTGIFDVILDVILVAVLSIYLLADGSRVSNWLRHNMPLRQQERMRFLLETLQRIMGGYIRGQLLLCGIIGVLACLSAPSRPTSFERSVC